MKLSCPKVTQKEIKIEKVLKLILGLVFLLGQLNGFGYTAEMNLARSKTVSDESAIISETVLRDITKEDFEKGIEENISIESKNGSEEEIKAEIILSDGTTWAQATKTALWSKRSGHTSLVYDNKMWVIGGDYKNDVWYSTDGINWTQATANAPWSKRFGHTSLIYDNKMWVIGGDYKNDVWYSTDGINWTRVTKTAPWSRRFGYTSLVYDNKMWVIGGWDGTTHRNDVWYSTDGINWTQATETAAWLGREGHTSLVYDNKMWVIGGCGYGRGEYGIHRIYENDVWYSTDGINWTQATANAPWSGRWDHTSLVYDNKIWVIGGGIIRELSTYNRNDAWYSTDGTNWIQATEAADWPKRSNHTSLVYDNKMWVIGGWDEITFRNDVWYSTDGINWTQATVNADWPKRSNHTSLVYDDKMWVIGGGHGNGVWYSTDGINWTQATKTAP